MDDLTIPSTHREVLFLEALILLFFPVHLNHRFWRWVLPLYFVFIFVSSVARSTRIPPRPSLFW